MSYDDEIWSFPYAKQKNVEKAKAAPEKAGDTWTWTALDADTKMIVSYLVDGRDAGYARKFMADVPSRLANRVQLLLPMAIGPIWRPWKALSDVMWTTGRSLLRCTGIRLKVISITAQPNAPESRRKR